MRDQLDNNEILKELHILFSNLFIRENKKHYSSKNENIDILSPGRVNLIGEHTDYNDGFSISIAINKYIVLTGNKTNAKKVRIFSKYFNEQIEFDLDNMIPYRNAHWGNYIKGVLKEYINKNYEISCFDLVIGGNLPIEIGLSSSAALEVGVAKFLKELFNLDINEDKMVDFCKNAENNFVGVDCGHLDQFTITYGKEENAIFIRFKDLSYQYIPIDLKDSIILIIDSKEKRNLSNTQYNIRREECREVLRIISSIIKDRRIVSLSDVNLDLLYEIKGKLPIELFRRVRHIVTENNRVKLSKDYLKNGDVEKFGYLLFESHKSLRFDYKVSTEKIDFLIDEIEQIKGVYGARLMGAGFGGSIISIVRKEELNNIINQLGEKYLDRFKKNPGFIQCIVSGGVKRIG
ncbi:MAG: galactokinase [Actinobacteria bacterium]|nr:galactokinase [Actinomycetota bacterium]